MTESTAGNRFQLRDVQIELTVRGSGAPLLLLHPEIGIGPDAPIIDELARHFTVHVPSHPGFGESELPRWMSEVEDLAYFYLDYLDAQGIDQAVVVGSSLGGWIAASMAVKSCERISHLVLAGSAGIKVGDREHRDFVDLFGYPIAQINAMSFADPARVVSDLTSLEEAALVRLHRNRESTALFAWSPYMHDPKLRGRLHRIKAPTLVLWGDQDRIVSSDYGRAFAQGIPDARFELMGPSGHYPHIEQPAAFAARVAAFAGR
jgi:pimeloyl-ACP methyl ester carboxylesterase